MTKGKPKNSYIWVVEMYVDFSGFRYPTSRLSGWEPTVGVAFNRDRAREELADWKTQNPDDKFRLKKYERIP